MSTIVASGHLESLSTRADRTIKVIIGLNELDDVYAAVLLGLRSKFIKVLITDSNITQQMMKSVEDTHLYDDKKAKTHSERLRHVLYRQWEKNKKGDFNSYYKMRMEEIIATEKEKIDSIYG